MKKRDFVQQAAIQFMPELQWNFDKSIDYAEKLYKRLQQRGYGDTPTNKAKDMVNYYEKLSTKSKKQFDGFWTAFDYKQGKQRAAMRWRQIGENSVAKQKKIVMAATATAASRKNLKPDATPAMAELWLSQLRFEDGDQSDTEVQNNKTNNFGIQVRELTSALNHAKSMQENTQDEFWPKEVERLTQALKKLRKN